MSLSKELLETMYGGSHYDRIVYMNKTGLAELLMSVQDVIFTVNFFKQVSENSIQDQLMSADISDYSDKSFAKSLIQGEERTMTCRMVQVENDLGRSVVVDLKTDHEYKIRQIDHRTINWIIFKNVKYELKKSGGQNFAEIDTRIGKDNHKWDPATLRVGDLFSGTSYYQVESEIDHNQVFCIEKSFNDRGVLIDKSLLNTDMINSSVYDSEESLSMTNLATKLTQANNMCFSVTFHTQANEKKILEILSEIKKAPKSAQEAKDLAKQCMVGEEKTLMCHLTKAEGTLGRSLVIDLPSGGFRQVDHRNIKSIIIDNVKYNLKK